MKKAVVFFMQFTFLFWLAFNSHAYEAIPFKNGGTIEGVVKYTGANVPTDPVLTVTTDTEYCGKTLPANKYLIKDRNIKNVIVYIEGVKAGKAIPHESAAVTSLKCEFSPRVSVGFKGNKFIMKNEDPVFHTFDVHVSQGGKELYHFAIPEKGSSVTKTLSKEGILSVTCYAHPWQRAYIYIFDHPYAVITDENGRFIIKDILPGTYTVMAWHEELGTKKIADIKVESGKIITITLEY